MSQHKIFITSWPHGQARLVEILGPHPSIKGGIYIRYEHGGSDTTTEEFLFDVPKSLNTMPLELTAENGMKGLLSGEFVELVEASCPACLDSDQDSVDCEYCDNTGEVTDKVTVSWTSIKNIYAKVASHFTGEV